MWSSPIQKFKKIDFNFKQGLRFFNTENLDKLLPKHQVAQTSLQDYTWKQIFQFYYLMLLEKHQSIANKIGHSSRGGFKGNLNFRCLWNIRLDRQLIPYALGSENRNKRSFLQCQPQCPGLSDSNALKTEVPLYLLT